MVQALTRVLRRPDRYILGFLEKALLAGAFDPKHPQVFILGLPRSGTTLIYQYVVHRLRVSYFTNGVGRYTRSPCIATFIQSRFSRPYSSDFVSSYGKVSGATAPREAGGFWGRVFGFKDYITYDDVSLEDVELLRRTVGCIEDIFGSVPFVNKNVKHMLRVDALSKIFPECYFLHVQRSLQDVGLSVLRARYKNLRDPRKWWSVRPPNYEEVKGLPIVDQVVEQLVALSAKLDADLARLPASRVLTVDYEAFCLNPDGLIDQLRTRLNGTAYRNEAIRSFSPSINRPERKQEEELVAALSLMTGPRAACGGA